MAVDSEKVNELSLELCGVAMKRAKTMNGAEFTLGVAISILGMFHDPENPPPPLVAFIDATKEMVRSISEQYGVKGTLETHEVM